MGQHKAISISLGELLGLGSQIGTIEAGKLADIIVVEGNPVDDIALLQDETRIMLVMQAGRWVKTDKTVDED